MEECRFLELLPFELRLRIYEELLQFNGPIKLRQVIPGSKNVSILRTNRQIHDEARPVLYDLNTIIVTRNDFCALTDKRLKTPLEVHHARHLLMVSFSQSIACTLAGFEEKCRVCQPSASGLMQILISMPKLRTAIVEYEKHLAEFITFTEYTRRIGTFSLIQIPEVEPHALRLGGPGTENVDIQFRCGRFE